MSRVVATLSRQHEPRPLWLVIQRQPHARRFEFIAHDGAAGYTVALTVDGEAPPTFPTMREAFAWGWARHLEPTSRRRGKVTVYCGTTRADCACTAVAA